MKTQVARACRACTLAVLLTVPTVAWPPSAQGSIPIWVPCSTIGSALVGGVLHLRYRHTAARRPPMTVQQRATDLVRPIATAAEMRELAKTRDDLQVNDFVNRLFARHDPTPDTPANEFRESYMSRYEEANRLYGGPGTRSERRRVYLQYGPPTSVQSLEVRLPDPQTDCKSAEIWEYNGTPGPNPFPPILRSPESFEDVFGSPLTVTGGRVFFFINISSADGLCRLAFTTEAGESFDHSIYQGFRSL